MSEDNKESTDNSLDIFGIKPVANAIEKVTDVAVDKAASFLTLICRPAAEEYGLMLRDKVKIQRQINAVNLVLKAEKKFKSLGMPKHFHANPRLVSRIIEEGSWIDDEGLQEMWAGLLTSSCSANGKDDSNLLFINYLSQITSLQAKVLNYGCTINPMALNNDGEVWPDIRKAGRIRVSHAEIIDVLKEDNLDRIALEFAYLNKMGLLAFTFGSDVKEAKTHVYPTYLGVSLYVRCQGFTRSAAEYYGFK